MGVGDLLGWGLGFSYLCVVIKFFNVGVFVEKKVVVVRGGGVVIGIDVDFCCFSMEVV